MREKVLGLAVDEALFFGESVFLMCGRVVQGVDVGAHFYYFLFLLITLSLDAFSSYSMPCQFLFSKLISVQMNKHHVNQESN
jgi:hypothetical protein